ncbi:cell division protein ZapA [Citreimonas salinaria]|uniref:Cell division protein ZapA n=1 Tax=Citreimonas salinaria TaxID=321339 RepID=A0A1H3GHE8_9RHOB|nr:cell division protein ZapA [Citreimonas salinaria]SDY02733.1 cell division protein ZapA [Citreimonas salinaria]
MAQTEIEITIGGRSFEVACQEGEEQYLHAAARMLDNEASVLIDQIGRIPESRMLLMAGLMLADRTVGLEERLREAEDRIETLSTELTELRDAPPPEPERVEVPVIPDSVTEAFAELTARAEALADALEEKARASS